MACFRLSTYAIRTRSHLSATGERPAHGANRGHGTWSVVVMLGVGGAKPVKSCALSPAGGHFASVIQERSVRCRARQRTPRPLRTQVPFGMTDGLFPTARWPANRHSWPPSSYAYCSWQPRTYSFQEPAR
jgi:hypothetical protein